ncbi:hypothetical protein K491DRAFT_758353 [Lophiostoma macrostomum CBS 122681]|uniref:CREG-like beta-barrel domain-containing protein n=1 Tax=Lophiostoma macrostomum CBS 122681 TaxID=1314788 RepID=A0A6A6T7T9_9PLEO|nr:hypothetical protein K491DRAFT_758353 [Lophiostoma macrostomum CBS 122681]
MHLTALLSSIPLIYASHLPSPQHIFSNPPSTDPTYKIPTVHESAIQARRILHLENIGTLSTIFPASSHSSSIDVSENRPSDVGGAPIGLMDYFADCEADSGNPTILAIKIATSFKNTAAGSNITLSLRWHPPYPSHRPYSAAAIPRFSLIGYLEDISPTEILTHAIPPCFVKSHPDAAAWLPGNRIHESSFVRLVVQEVYWIGGFGDRAYIGWIPVETWKNVTGEEIEACRLPGEKTQAKGKKDGWRAGWRSWLGLGGAGAEEEGVEGWEL